MTGWAAVLLAAALLAAPGRRRLAPPRRTAGRRRATIPIGALLAAAALAAGPAVTVSAALLTVAMTARGRRSRRRAATRREGETLAAALEVLVGELRVGAHPVHAFAVAAGESDGVTATFLAALAARARLGSDVPAALQITAALSSVPQHWTRIAICWRLAAEHGLPIALLMQAAHRDITRRQRFADRVDAGLAGARATATVLAALPVMGVLLGHLLGAQPLRYLLGEGGWVLAVGVALQCAGLSWSDRLTSRAVP